MAGGSCGGPGHGGAAAVGGGAKRARVTVFREESGAVGLSGRDLPAAEALSGHASVLARAGQYEASGAFPGQAASSLQALAYLHLLNGVTAQDAIAFARTATAEPPPTVPAPTTRTRRGPAARTGSGTGAPGDSDGHGDGRGRCTTATIPATARARRRRE